MVLNCLLLTGDATLLEVFRTGFLATVVELETHTDAASAIELAAHGAFDPRWQSRSLVVGAGCARRLSSGLLTNLVAEVCDSVGDVGSRLCTATRSD